MEEADTLRLKLAAATRSRWLALGEANGEAVLLSCDLNDAAFRAPLEPLPEAFPRPASWREILAWDESVWLVCAREVWTAGDDASWRLVWTLGDPRLELRGALRVGRELWVWGESASGTGVWRFDARGFLLGAPANFRVGQIACAPGVLGDEIVLAGQSLDGARAPLVLCGRVALGEVARPVVPFEAGARAVAVIGIKREAQSALLLALEAGGRVSLRAHVFGEHARTVSLGEPLPMADDGAASFSWCVCDDRLISLWRAPDGHTRGAEFDLSRAAFWNG